MHAGRILAGFSAVSDRLSMLVGIRASVTVVLIDRYHAGVPAPFDVCRFDLRDTLYSVFSQEAHQLFMRDELLAHILRNDLAVSNQRNGCWIREPFDRRK